MLKQQNSEKFSLEVFSGRKGFKVNCMNLACTTVAQRAEAKVYLGVHSANC